MDIMSKSKRIGSFKQFLKDQRLKKLNENKLHVEVEWWDQCILEVFQELEIECDGCLAWDTIIKFCKDKWAILGRTLPQPEYDDNILTQHIKDLIFQFHWDSFYTDLKCDFGWDNAQIHSKGLVIEELASVILDKVKDKAFPEHEIETQNPTGTLSDREETKMVPMKPAQSNGYEDEDCVDLPVGFESRKGKPVKGFEAYTKALNETVTIIDIASEEACINYCLDRIKKEVGSYDPQEMLNMALEAADPKVKARLVLLYVKDMVTDYLSKEKAQFGLVDVNGYKGKTVPKDVLEKGLDELFHDIADEVLVKIAEINGISLSDEEV